LSAVSSILLGSGLLSSPLLASLHFIAQCRVVSCRAPLCPGMSVDVILHSCCRGTVPAGSRVYGQCVCVGCGR
jgi:hypothetical protein